jgi:HlyD family secretion protein
MARLRIDTYSRFFAVLALSSVSLLAGGCKKADETVAAVVYVQAVHPQRSSISEQVTADATLAPLAQAAISPKVTAPVKKFYVQRGSRVKAGQLLATLENGDLTAAALDSKGAYTAAQATYDTATRAVAPEDYTRAQLDLAQAKAALDLNQSIVKSRTQLLAQGAIPGRDLDTAKAALVQAQVSRKAALENAQGQLASAKGKYLGAQAQLSYTEIRSPIDGVVTDRPLFAGETAAAATPVITVMDTSALLAKLHIAQMQAQQLTVGAPATVTIPGVAEPVPAKVTLISPALDPGSTTVEVWLRVENPKGSYRAGTAVHATIEGQTVPDALTIPAEAVQTAADGVTKSVMLIGPDGAAHKHGVSLGIQTPQSVQVLDGVGPNDMVITTGAYAMDDGTKVKIGTPPSSADDNKGDDVKEKDGK